MNPGRQVAIAHQAREIRMSAALSGLVYELLKRWARGDWSDRDTIVGYIAATQIAHAGSVQRAIEMIEAIRRLEAPGRAHAAPVAAEFDEGAAYGRISGVMQDAKALDPRALTYARDLELLLQAAAVTAQRHALNAGRRTVEASTAANGTTWRRVTDGKPCAFCAMLATRDDYTSRDAALKVQGRRGRPRGRRALGSSYHDRCGCTAVEVLDTWEPTRQEQAYQQLYTQAREACEADGVPPTTENILARMRRDGGGVVNDAPKPKTSTGKGGGGKPPRRVRGMLGADGPDEFPRLGGRKVPFRRSDIEEFDLLDAEILLDGDGSGHGLHRHGSGAGKSEFPPGWGEREVVDWVNAIIDNPQQGKVLDDNLGADFYGIAQNVAGVVVVRRHGRWFIATAHPLPLDRWP